MNPHSIAAKHRDPKPELRPSSSRTIPPEEGPIHVTSRQPSAHPQAPCRPSAPLAHPGGAATLTKAPLVSSALNSRGEGRPVQDPRAFPRRLSRPGLCPGFLRKRGRAPLRPVRGCGPPRVERTWTVPAGSRPAPPQCPDAPGWGALRLTRDPGALLLSLCSRAPLPPAAQSLALLPNYPH